MAHAAAWVSCESRERIVLDRDVFWVEGMQNFSRIETLKIKRESNIRHYNFLSKKQLVLFVRDEPNNGVCRRWCEMRSPEMRNGRLSSVADFDIPVISMINYICIKMIYFALFGPGSHHGYNYPGSFITEIAHAFSFPSSGVPLSKTSFRCIKKKKSLAEVPVKSHPSPASSDGSLSHVNT